MPSKSLSLFAAASDAVEVKLTDGVWFAVSQLVMLIGGEGPVKLTLDGPVAPRVFDLVIQALGIVNSANFNADVEPPDYFTGVVLEKGTGNIWWKSTKVPDRMVSVAINWTDETAVLSWNTGTGATSRHVQQIFSGIRGTDLL
jgi:hypothetical protein